MLISERMHYSQITSGTFSKKPTKARCLSWLFLRSSAISDPHIDCNCQHLQSIHPSSLPFRETINQNSKGGGSFSLHTVALVFCFLADDCVLFSSVLAEDRKCAGQWSYVVWVLRGLRFESFKETRTLFFVCAQGWVGAWVRSGRVGDNERLCRLPQN